MRPLTVLAGSALLAGGIAGFAFLAPSAWPRTQAQRAEAERLSLDVEALRDKTDELERSVRRMRGEGPGAQLAIEGVIRDELGYIGADEHLLIFDEPPAPPHAPTPAEAKAMPGGDEHTLPSRPEVR